VLTVRRRCLTDARLAPQADALAIYAVADGLGALSHRVV
jgi:hypothetical protein